MRPYDDNERAEWEDYFRKAAAHPLERGIPAPLPQDPGYRVGRILSAANHKQGKTKTHRVVGLTLAPRDSSGGRVNLCPHASSGCSAVCLAEQDRLAWRPNKLAAIARTLLWMNDPSAFYMHLAEELEQEKRQAQRAGLPLAVRLNVVSDIAWEREAPWLFTGPLRGASVYDYTKTPHRLRGPLPPNYHLTFSRSEENEAEAKELLAKGVNVAVVFSDKPFPKTFWGRPVLPGDDNDLRFLDLRDTPGYIIGLRAKGKKAWTDTTGFVVPKNGAAEVSDWWETEEVES